MMVLSVPFMWRVETLLDSSIIMTWASRVTQPFMSALPAAMLPGIVASREIAATAMPYAAGLPYLDDLLKSIVESPSMDCDPSRHGGIVCEGARAHNHTDRWRDGSTLRAEARESGAG
jgi:hypothetical protein